MIGKINFLAGKTRPFIIFVVHQCAKYSIYPKQSHEESVKRIGHYLKKKKDKDLFLQPMDQMGFNVIPVHILLEHSVKEMQINLDQFYQEWNTLSNSKIVQSFG